MHVPGWHEATRDLQQQGKLAMAGIIQEQHPDRARLFMQWKEMPWPLLVDSLNLLGVTAVPITVAIDEHGIVQAKGIKPGEAAEFAARFVGTSYPAPASQAPGRPAVPDPAELQKIASARQYADALFLWGGPQTRSEVIGQYRKAMEGHSGEPALRFRLGVAYRARYDSPFREPGDFQAAVDHWQQALDGDPNQYIWRRRIQQYGPRLDKPYPFYDWVPQARQDIRDRGQTPAELSVEPGGAEFAKPSKDFVPPNVPATEPDSRGRVHRDETPFVLTEQTVVPAAITPGSAARVHIIFRPNQAKKAHWNNEADGLEVWLHPPSGWETDVQRLVVDNPPEAVSLEPRQVEFEVRVPKDAPPGRHVIPGYALYYVCEDVHGVCLYRRQDLRVTVPVRGQP